MSDVATSPRLSFDDDKPDDKRKMQQIFLRPSLRAEIKKRRGKLSRSAWIERAIYAQLAEGATMSDVAKGCATCRFMIVPPDARGRRVVRPDKAYRCGYVVAWPPLPVSITSDHGFRLPDPKTRGVWKGFGLECPTWEPLS